MSQKKVEDFLDDIHNVLGISDNILIPGLDADGRDHDVRLEQVLQRCRQANLKINLYKKNIYSDKHAYNFLLR